MKLRVAALLCALLFARPLLALAPEDGIWWNPAQSGRGWFIINQNDLMLVASYGYAQGGMPAWYLSIGSYNDANKSFSASLDGYANGQCIGCPYRAPSPTASPGTLSITFIDERRATLRQAGETVAIEKFYYAHASNDDRLYGEWTYAGHVAFGIGDAEFLIFDSAFTSSSTGKQYVALKRRFSTSGIGLGRFEPTLNEYLVLLDSSTSNYKTYIFKMENNRIVNGRWWLHPKTQTPSGPGSTMHGLRTAERNDVGARKTALQEPDFDARDAMLAAHWSPSEASASITADQQAAVAELIATYEHDVALR